jgi:fructose-specific phosphotransferase system IIA component
MKIVDFLNVHAITTNLEATDKESVIRELVELLAKVENIKDKDKENLVKSLLEREALGSTGIGQGVGIPHCKSESVKELVAAFGISRKGANFDSLDGEPVYIFFLLVAPQDTTGPHLKALARISRLLRDKYFRDALRAANDEKELFRIIKEEDKKKQ